MSSDPPTPDSRPPHSTGSRPPGASSCDVIVVGAGPAGSVAARTLALGGARVLVLERGRFPRNKPCGGGLTYRALRRFPWLEPALPRITTHRIGRLHMEVPGGDHVSIDAGRPVVLMIRRVEFDHLLVDLAREAGAELVEGAEILQAEAHAGGVRLKARDGRTFEAPLVIAADGVHSVVAKRLGFNRAWPAASVALDMMEETPTGQLQCRDPDALWVFYGYGSAHGYAYVFPKRDHVNVGIGCVLEAYKASGREAPYDLQQKFVGWLREQGALEGRSSRETFTPYLIPVGGPLPATAGARVLLAGDAGGFVNGFTAEGIYFAMVTGDLAAQAILGGSPRSYERLWRREIGAELRESNAMRRFVFARQDRVGALVQGLRAFPAVARLLVDYATGDLGYAAARRRFVARFPGVALRLAADQLDRAWRGRLCG